MSEPAAAVGEEPVEDGALPPLEPLPPGEAEDEDAPPREELLEEAPVPPLAARVRAVLGAPWAAFARHDARWGWAAPWLVVAALGLVYGALALATVDFEAVTRATQERALDTAKLPVEASAAASGPEVQEAQAMMVRFGTFMAKVKLLAAPPLGGLVSIVVFGVLAFAASRLFAPPERRAEPIRAISMSAYAHLPQGLGYVALALAVLAGNPAPNTSPAALVDPFAHGVAATVLWRLDPTTLYGYALFAAGLEGTCGLARGRALAVALGLWAAVTAPFLLLALVGAAFGG